MAIINYDKDLPSNSKTEKIEKVEKEEVEPKKKIISGKATVKKRASLIKKFRDTFIVEDISNVKRYVFDEVLIPGIKNLFVDTISMFILGDSYRGRPSYSRRDRTSYSVRLDSDRKTSRYTATVGGKYRDVVYETREDAEDVLDDLLSLIDRYGKATVSDLYSASGITPDFTDEKYGWLDLKRATIRRVPDGYILDMPKAYPLD